MKIPKTESLNGWHGNAGKTYRRVSKRAYWKGNRRAAKADPEGAPRRVRSKGWA